MIDISAIPTGEAAAVDAGHLLPEHVWQVVRQAARDPEADPVVGLMRYADTAPAPKPRGLLSLPGGTVDAAPDIAGMWIPARSYGGSMRPLGVGLHSVECPLRAGYAESLARYWFGAQAPTSTHFIVDPAAIIQQVATTVRAWHIGNANPWLWGVEQAGYARFTPADWLTLDGRRQLANVAALIRTLLDRIGAPVRIASAAEARAAQTMGRPIGIVTHNAAREAWGGTTHTDPGTGYPFDALLEEIRTGTSTIPVITPKPKPKDIVVKIIRNSDSGACYLVGPTGYQQIPTEDKLKSLTDVWGDYINMPGQRANHVLEAAASGGKALVSAVRPT